MTEDISLKFSPGEMRILIQAVCIAKNYYTEKMHEAIKADDDLGYHTFGNMAHKMTELKERLVKECGQDSEV